MSGLPQGWVQTTLGDFVLWGSGGTPSRSVDSYFGGSIPWVTISDLNDGLVTTTYNSITEIAVQNSSAKYVEPFSVMIALYGSIGKLGIAGTKLTTNQAIAYAQLDESSFNYKYLFYLLSCSKEKLLASGAGITQKNIYLSDLKAFECPLAPRAEQTRIVAKLDALLSALDEGVAQLKAAQKKLVQYRQSLLKAAVEGSLTAAWRAQQSAQNISHETGEQLLTHILAERRQRWQAKQLAKFAAQGKPPPKDWQSKYPEPAKPDTSALPDLPQGWVWASAEQLCEFITKGTTPSKNLNETGGKNIPFLRVTNLTDKGFLDMNDKVWISKEVHTGFLERSIVYPKDVLMNIVGPPLGQVSVVPENFPEYNINQAIAIFRAIQPISPIFICLSLLSKPTQNWLLARSKTTAGQTNLTLETCRALPIALPPIEEQSYLVQKYEELAYGAESQVFAINTALKQSAAQRKNILKAAFAGELVPQDPQDEPASALLARIAAQRAAVTTAKVASKSTKRQTKLPHA